MSKNNTLDKDQIQEFYNNCERMQNNSAFNQDTIQDDVEKLNRLINKIMDEFKYPTMLYGLRSAIDKDIQAVEHSRKLLSIILDETNDTLHISINFKYNVHKTRELLIDAMLQDTDDTFSFISENIHRHQDGIQYHYIYKLLSLVLVYVLEEYRTENEIFKQCNKLFEIVIECGYKEQLEDVMSSDNFYFILSDYVKNLVKQDDPKYCMIIKSLQNALDSVVEDTNSETFNPNQEFPYELYKAEIGGDSFQQSE